MNRIVAVVFAFFLLCDCFAINTGVLFVNEQEYMNENCDTCEDSIPSHSVAIPLTYYGVWSRGDFDKVKYNQNADYILGMEVSKYWEDIQPSFSDGIDFSVFQRAIESAAISGRILKLSIDVGPNSPKWIYDHGVPLVKCSEHYPPKSNFPDFPYYLDEDYKTYYFTLVREFASFLRNQPEHLRKTISFVQVKTGCTGDECAYKGEPLDSQYAISETQWREFRLESFEVFKAAFNDSDSNNTPPIALVFNVVDPYKDPDEFNWLNENINPKIGYGIKGGAYIRGHHLTGEKSFKETWNKYLLNPKGMALFSATEMDQTWRLRSIT